MAVLFFQVLALFLLLPVKSSRSKVAFSRTRKRKTSPGSSSFRAFPSPPGGWSGLGRISQHWSFSLGFPGKIQNIQVQRGGGKKKFQKGIYRAQKTLLDGFAQLFHGYSLSPLHFLQDSALFSLPPSPPRWIREGFVGQIRFCVCWGRGGQRMNPNVHFTTSPTSQGSSEHIQGLGKGGSWRGRSCFQPGAKGSLGRKRKVWEISLKFR